MTNRELAAKLQRVADLLDAQGANAFRVAAYRRAAETVQQLGTPLINIVRDEGPGALDALPGIGPRLAHALADAVLSGRLAMLERLEGAIEPEAISPDGARHRTAAGRAPASRTRDQHARGARARGARRPARALEGIGARRTAGIAAALGSRLARPRGGARAGEPPPVGELLDVDAEYRRRAKAGELAMIAPRRFNPKHEAWLPVLHAVREPRHYTALFSNTARAHQLGTTKDWVVIYLDGGKGEQQYTVVTAHSDRCAAGGWCADGTRVRAPLRGGVTARRASRATGMTRRRAYGSLGGPHRTPPHRPRSSCPPRSARRHPVRRLTVTKRPTDALPELRSAPPPGVIAHVGGEVRRHSRRRMRNSSASVPPPPARRRRTT